MPKFVKKTEIHSATLSDLHQDPQNARKHNPRNIGMIESSLRQVGAARSGVIDEDGMILAGNGTYDALTAAGINKVKIVEANGEEWVVVRRKGLTTEQKRALAIADNRAAELAEWDGPALAAQGIDLAAWFNDGELAKIGAASPTEAEEGPAPQLDKAEALRKKYRVEPGQMWQLGEHRLMCGDSRTRRELERVLILSRPTVLTDPPYGISVVSGKGTGKVGGGGATHFGKIGGGNWVESHTYADIIGDDTTRTAKSFVLLCREIGLTEYIIWGGNYFTEFLAPSRCWIIWDKQNTGNFADVELAWTSFNKGARLYSWLWNGLSREGTRTEELKSRIHPAQKPVGLFKKIMEDFPAESYLDGFLGSGTTLIACEQLGRRCYAMEISPAYVAVAIQRWVDLTGKEPKLENARTRTRTPKNTDKAAPPSRQPRQAAAER